MSGLVSYLTGHAAQPRVVSEVLGADRFAFTLVCEDSRQISLVASSVCDTRGGQIAHQYAEVVARGRFARA